MEMHQLQLASQRAQIQNHDLSMDEMNKQLEKQQHCITQLSCIIEIKFIFCGIICIEIFFIHPENTLSSLNHMESRSHEKLVHMGNYSKQQHK